MIPSIVIKNYLQEKLGINYGVEVDGYKDVRTKLTSASVYLTRQPYFSDLGTEAITIRIELYANVSTVRDTAKFHEDMKSLFEGVNGVKNTVIYNSVSYKFRVYLQSLELQEVATDSGKEMALYFITGIIIASSSGAVSGDDISVKIAKGGAYDQLILIRYACDYTVNHDLIVPINSTEVKGSPSFTSRIYSVTFIADTTAMSRYIEKTANGIGSTFMTDIFSLQITASDGTTETKNVLLQNAVIDATIGAFMTITATFRA